jgi:predicted ArsR family transcriptional regulator
MVAIVTPSKALNIANQLAAKDGEKLFRQMRERRRKAWLAEFEAASRQALEDLRAGRLKALSTPEEIKQHLDRIWKSDNA